MLNRLRYSDVVATIALFAALGGTTYAAVKLGRNAVHTRNIAANAVTSPKVKDGSLLAADFKAGQLPVGANGATGPAGPAGPKGDAGAKGDKGDVGNTGQAGAGTLQVTAVQAGGNVVIGSGCVTTMSVTIVTPSAGTVVVSGTQQVVIDHTNGATTDLATLAIEPAPADCTTSGQSLRSFWNIPGAMPTDTNYRNEVAVQRSFSVAAGSHTYDVGAYVTPGGNVGDTENGGVLTAVFYPS